MGFQGDVFRPATAGQAEQKVRRFDRTARFDQMAGDHRPAFAVPVLNGCCVRRQVLFGQLLTCRLSLVPA
jgi:hypothetical protein